MHISQQLRTLTREQVRGIYVSDKSVKETASAYHTDPDKVRRIWRHELFRKDLRGLPHRLRKMPWDHD